jgi:hypothetical protein
MSSGEDKSRESSPTGRPASKTSSRGSSQGPASRQPSGPANIIEFVDSQDPNVKSAIQRHTAYHSAAQRRDARLRSLRRGNQSRYLEWGRRPVSEPPDKTPSGNQTSGPAMIAPGSHGTTTKTQSSELSDLSPSLLGPPTSTSAPQSRSISPRVPLSAREESILQSCK